MVDLMKIQLSHPLKVTREKNGAELETEIKELTLQPIRAKHLKYVPREPENVYFIVPLLAALSGLTEAEAGELDLEDIMKAVALIAPFLEGLPTIGKK